MTLHDPATAFTAIAAGPGREGPPIAQPSTVSGRGCAAKRFWLRNCRGGACARIAALLPDGGPVRISALHAAL
jgi:hypothetical protein